MQSISGHSCSVCRGTYHSSSSESQSHGGKMMCPLDAAIA